jgi:hypothetical protein
MAGLEGGYDLFVPIGELDVIQSELLNGLLPSHPVPRIGQQHSADVEEDHPNVRQDFSW